jgi:hypothetical protein
MTLDEYFTGHEDSRRLFDVLSKAIDEVAPAEVSVTKSQVAFRRRKAFAWAWIPGKYLHGKVAPLVLSIALSTHDDSPRWKEVVEPYPGRFIHHLELYFTEDLDDEVKRWLRAAWDLSI